MGKKHIPIRTCIVCKKKAPKFELRRYIWIKEENKLEQDIKQVKPGRGFYICSLECAQKIDQNKGWLKKCKGVKK